MKESSPATWKPTAAISVRDFGDREQVCRGLMRAQPAAIGGELAFRTLRRISVAPPVDLVNGLLAVVAAPSAGITILAGPTPTTRSVRQHAFATAPLHNELAQLVGAELTPVDTINAVSASSACYFCLPARATIAAGQGADLSLVRTDPIADFTAVSDVAAVWVGGERIAKKS